MLMEVVLKELGLTIIQCYLDYGLSEGLGLIEVGLSVNQCCPES